jgi:hypothetical protein
MTKKWKGWPFETWTQGYVLGLLNGAIFGAVASGFIQFISAIVGAGK